MKFKNQLRFDEINFLEFRRALMDFRSGIPVNIDEINFTIASPETISRSFFERFFSSNSYLVIPDSRAEYFGMDSNVLSLSRIKFSEVLDFVKYNIPIENVEHTSLDLPDVLMKIPKLVKLLPCFLVSTKKVDGFLEIKTDDIEDYRYLLTDSLEIVDRSNLIIKSYQDIAVELVLFRSTYTSAEHYAIIIGNNVSISGPFVRVHSSCFTGDVLGSLSCDCMDQLHMAIEFLSTNGGGVITYINQEGRGIGLAAKLKAYNLQHNLNLDTFEANLALGFAEDEREFQVAAQMLAALSISSVKLLTNNPQKVFWLEDLGIRVEQTYNLDVEMHEFNEKYLKTKASKMAHMIKVVQEN
jgi:GTP cyclohydrolase II